MPNRHDRYPKLSPVGESGLLIELGDSLDPHINRKVHTLDACLQRSRLEGVCEWLPAYASILVLYDPLLLTLADVRRWIEEALLDMPEEVAQTGKHVDIPVKYGGEEGPDLAFVADYHGLSPQTVIQKHSSQVYVVGMMGFTPGFAYLMGMDPGLATPRLSTPRTHVPGGSVGIAGLQTGIYPSESPGGWQIIGRTDLTLFNPEFEQPFLLSPGDEVCFIPIEDCVS